MNERTEEEVKQIDADAAYWRELEPLLGWMLHGFSGRAGASYFGPGHPRDAAYINLDAAARDGLVERYRAMQHPEGTEFYGSAGTVHGTTEVDVETYKGRVIAVWFRCMRLPFKQETTDAERAAEMRRVGDQKIEVHGITYRRTDK